MSTLEQRLSAYVSGNASSVGGSNSAFLGECLAEAAALVQNEIGTTGIKGFRLDPQTVTAESDTLTAVVAFSYLPDVGLARAVFTVTHVEGASTIGEIEGENTPAAYYPADNVSVSPANGGTVTVAPDSYWAVNVLGITDTRTITLHYALKSVPQVSVTGVPLAIYERAVIEVGAELYYRKSSPQGISQFTATDGSAIRVRQDPMVAARSILAPFLPGGFA